MYGCMIYIKHIILVGNNLKKKSGLYWQVKAAVLVCEEPLTNCIQAFASDL